MLLSLLKVSVKFYSKLLFILRRKFALLLEKRWKNERERIKKGNWNNMRKVEGNKGGGREGERKEGRKEGRKKKRKKEGRKDRGRKEGRVVGGWRKGGRT